MSQSHGLHLSHWSNTLHLTKSWGLTTSTCQLRVVVTLSGCFLWKRVSFLTARSLCFPLLDLTFRRAVSATMLAQIASKLFMRGKNRRARVAADDFNRSGEAYVVRIPPGRLRRLEDRLPDHVVRDQQAPELLPRQRRRLAPESLHGSPQDVRLDLVVQQLRLPALVVQRGQLLRGEGGFVHQRGDQPPLADNLAVLVADAVVDDADGHLHPFPVRLLAAPYRRQAAAVGKLPVRQQRHAVLGAEKEMGAAPDDGKHVAAAGMEPVPQQERPGGQALQERVGQRRLRVVLGPERLRLPVVAAGVGHLGVEHAPGAHLHERVEAKLRAGMPVLAPVVGYGVFLPDGLLVGKVEVAAVDRDEAKPLVEGPGFRPAGVGQRPADDLEQKAHDLVAQPGAPLRYGGLAGRAAEAAREYPGQSVEDVLQHLGGRMAGEEAEEDDVVDEKLDGQLPPPDGFLGTLRHGLADGGNWHCLHQAGYGDLVAGTERMKGLFGSGHAAASVRLMLLPVHLAQACAII
jgi:hypothetical protein